MPARARVSARAIGGIEVAATAKTKLGKIIFLNGVSSAGKTTLAKALQQKLDEPYYWLSEDAFRATTPAKYDEDDGEHERAWVDSIFAMYHVAKMFSGMGMCAIVDTVMDDDIWEEKAVEALRDSPALLVRVTCPPEELQRREKERGDREIGLAIDQLSQLCTLDNTCDIAVDTHANTAEECADRIIALLDDADNFLAFKALWKRRCDGAGKQAKEICEKGAMNERR